MNNGNSMNNMHAEMLIVLAKGMPLLEIVSSLAKSSDRIKSLLSDGTIKPIMEEMQKYPAFTELMLYSQLFITKMAYEDQELSKALKDVNEHKKDFEMREEVNRLKSKGSN